MENGLNLSKNKYRHEFKYYINYFDYESLKSRLKIILKKDKYADIDGNYEIRSLYFEDLKNTALFEKQSGVLSRKKYRIRIYNFSDKVIKLEKKARVGQFISKESTSLSRAECDEIIKGKISFLRNSQIPLLREFYIDSKINIYKPEVIVDYTREAYVHELNNIRITFDKRLRTGLNRVDIFNSELPAVDVLEEPKMILEVKYDNFLPEYVRSAIHISRSQRYAISKYVICRKYLKVNSWEDN